MSGFISIGGRTNTVPAEQECCHLFSIFDLNGGKTVNKCLSCPTAVFVRQLGDYTTVPFRMKIRNKECMHVCKCVSNTCRWEEQE